MARRWVFLDWWLDGWIILALGETVLLIRAVGSWLRSAVLHPPIPVPTSHVTDCWSYQLLQKFETAVSIDFESFGFPFLGSGSTACSPWTARYYRSPHTVCVSFCSNLWQRDYQESFKKCSEESQAMFPCQWQPLPAPAQIEATEAFLQCVFWCSLVIK